MQLKLRFLDDYAKKNIISKDDWYSVKQEEIVNAGGSGLVKRFRSHIYALLNLYPNEEWTVHRFKHLPHNYWESKDNQRTFIEEIAKRLDVKHWEEWYTIKVSDFVECGGAGILNHYGGSLLKALAAVYPSHPWRMDRVFSDQFLASRSNFEPLVIKERYSSPSKSQTVEDLFPEGEVPQILQTRGITSESVLKLDASTLSLQLATFWRDPANQLALVEKIGKKLGVKNWEDWYNVTDEDFLKCGGQPLLNEHASSLRKVLRSVYPQHIWVWKGKRESEPTYRADRTHVLPHPLNYYESRERQLEFFDELAKKLEIKSWEDWYRVTSPSITPFGGTAILAKFFGQSLSTAITKLYPNHDWKIWKFEALPRNFWTNTENQKIFMVDLGKKLKIRSFEDWHRVTSLTREIIDHGGKRLLNLYSQSPIKILQALYPEHDWITSAKAVPSGYWQDIRHQREHLDALAKKLGVVDKEDWYRVKISSTDAKFVDTQYGGSLIKALQAVYPEHKWETAPFSWNSKHMAQNSQFHVFHRMKELFPDATIHSDFDCRDMIADILNSPASLEDLKAIEAKFNLPSIFTYKFEADVAVPTLNLVVEYQGEQHYFDNTVWGDLSVQRLRDQRKKEIFNLAGVTLVEVPFWWDGNKRSLAGTIAALRPDLAKAMERSNPGLLDFSVVIFSETPPSLVAMKDRM
eukprot:TRINITY_DN5106_c0_g1_i2.p1 TRINITY_DN5106_c0_g1~~TRINITY_DN5106_c0_g1_i2.p1  ORF type:complete len:690 (-),score=185.35 TRINITY_DN5106_c0_g1_i2:125-2194(-)